MSYQVPIIEPKTITLGDLASWRRVLGDYPASTWTLTYYLRNSTSGDAETITAGSDGDDHLISVAAATTATWAAGTYYWKAIVSSGLERYTVDEGTFIIESNPAVTTTDDSRTDAKIILDALIAAFKDRASRPEKQYGIAAAGRNFTFHTLEEWQKAIAYWSNVVKSEEDAVLAAKGKNTGRRILIKF